MKDYLPHACRFHGGPGVVIGYVAVSVVAYRLDPGRHGRVVVVRGGWEGREGLVEVLHQE